MPGYEAASIYGVFAPAKSAVTVINRLNREMVRFLNLSDAKDRFSSVGVEAIGSSPEAFAAVIKYDMIKWGKVIRDAGIRAD